MKRALLLNWFDLAAGSEAAFDSWHNREHVIERLAVPGFIGGRRYVSIDRPAPTGHGWLVAYDATDLSILESAAYAAHLKAPTPLKQQVVPLLRQLTRTAYEIQDSLGQGLGGFARTIRVPALGAVLAGNARPCLDDLAAVYACDGVTRVQLCRSDRAATHFKDTTREGGDTQTLARDDYPWALFVETCRPDALDSAQRAFERTLAERWPHPAARFESHSYQLVFALDRVHLGP